MAPRPTDRGVPVREVVIGLLAIVLLAAGALVVASGGLASPAHALPVPVQDQDGPPLLVTATAAGAAEATGLDPDLLGRFGQARAAAREAGVELTITSGWRSAADQQALLDKEIALRGSRDEAIRWVLPPERSAHVRGTAIDVGGQAGMAWLEENGPTFGLCRVYQNEPWHFEPTAEPGEPCPALLVDASEDRA